MYNGTLPNEHTSRADTHNIMDNSVSPDRFSTDFNTLEILEILKPRYSVQQTLFTVIIVHNNNPDLEGTF